jgi:PAS domain S-box-containing protein
MTDRDTKVLVVDDQEANLEVMRGLLRRIDAEILLAHSGQQALELLLIHDVALAIVDVQMPIMDGFELAELMRGVERTRHVPIIFLTAGDHDNERRFRGYDAGAVDFLYKPVEPEVLRRKVTVFVQLSAQRQDLLRQRDELQAIAEDKSRLVQQLQESEERFRALADNMPTLAWMMDETGWVYWFNRRWYDYTGTTFEDMQGWGWQQVHHPDHVERVVASKRRALETGEPWDETFPLRGQDGEFRWFLTRAVPIRDADGRITRWFGTNTDVSERKRVEEAFAERGRQQAVLYELASAVNRADQLGDLYEKALDAILLSLHADRASILLFDQPGVMQFQAWRGLSDGYRQAVAGHSPWKPAEQNPVPITIPNLAVADIPAELRAVIQQEGIQALGFIPLSYGGRLIGKFMVYFNQPHAMTAEDIGVARAIANTVATGVERKRAEAAIRESEERSRAMAEQLRLLTQDLERRVEARTNDLILSQEQLRALATELNLTEQRERKRLATELHDHLAQLLVLCRLRLGQSKRIADVAPECQRLIKQTEEVLDEALTYTRTLVADLAPPVLHDFGLPAALKWLADYMERHELAVTLEMAEDLKLELPEDQAVLLFQSIRELLMNASKHAQTGVAVVSLAEQHGVLRIEVRDEGKGMDPLQAVVPSLPSKFGLFSIRERMRALGGSFEIDSAPGKGTTARLMLPLIVAEARGEGLGAKGTAKAIRQPGQSLPLASRRLPNASAKIRVLLVDDHAMVRQGLRTLLDGYADLEVVGEASNGEEAVALVETQRPAVVVMDINMPKKNGIEATAEIKARYPTTVVIGISVQANGEAQDAMMKAGAAMLLTKEAAVDELYEAIRKTL